MNKIKFSVLLSVYKNEKSSYLKEAFESIYKNQTLKPDEIILVEDGPLTSDLEKTITELKNELGDILKIIKIKENVGLGNALKIGMKYCNNEYIARMDTDDISKFDRFEKQINYLKNNPTVDVLGTYMYEFENNIENIVSLKTAPQNNFKKYMKRRDPVNHATVILKKSKVIEAGGYLDMLYNEDTYLWARMLNKNFNFKNIQEPLLYVRVSESFYKRRGGKEFFKIEYQLQKELYRLQITNKIDFIFNLLAKSTFRIIPNSLRKIIYLRVLREKKNEV